MPARNGVQSLVLVLDIGGLVTKPTSLTAGGLAGLASGFGLGKRKGGLRQ